MQEIVFTTRLTVEDWDEAMHGWRCHVLNVPGAIVEAVYVEGSRVDSARYEVLTQHTFIRWIASDQPQRVAASIKLTETLSLGKETERWKRLAIILPVVATIIAAVISGAATYLSRTPEVHTPIALVGPPISRLPASQVQPTKSDGTAIDVINSKNTSFDSALAIKLGPTYLSRFINDDSSLYFSFHQQEGAHDLNVTFILVTPDDEVRPIISIYSRSHAKLFSRWHDTKDGSTINWTPPIMPGDYVVEIKPNGASSNFAHFLLSLTSG